MGERKAYPSDLTDEQWAVVGPFLHAWKARHPSVSGHQGRYELREIVNAIFYQNGTGCQWAYLPHDLPQKPATSRCGATTAPIKRSTICCAARRERGPAGPRTAIILDIQ